MHHILGKLLVDRLANEAWQQTIGSSQLGHEVAAMRSGKRSCIPFSLSSCAQVRKRLLWPLEEFCFDVAFLPELSLVNIFAGFPEGAGC